MSQHLPSIRKVGEPVQEGKKEKHTQRKRERERDRERLRENS